MVRSIIRLVRLSLLLAALALVGSSGAGAQKIPNIENNSNLACSAFAPALLQEDSQLFPATGYRVGGPFLQYWRRNGGLAVFGYPITGEKGEDGLVVQYFERAIFELHPENSPPYNVLLRRLGATLTQGRQGEPPFLLAQPIASPGCTYYPGTGHNLCAGFRSYWNQFGGPSVYGYPVSEEFREVNRDDGKTYIVQYFERQRFEWHPGEWPQRLDVLLGRLGVQALANMDGEKGVSIEVPSPDERVTLPLHILARGVPANQQVIAHLRWQDGTVLTNTVVTLAGEDGRGLLIANLDWLNEGRPPMPPTQPATLEINTKEGTVIAQLSLTVLGNDDPDTQLLDLYWLLGGGPDQRLVAVQRRVLATRAIGTAALEELLWGPEPPNLAGFTTALPSPYEVLGYSGRGADWGSRVRLLSLVIENGVASANFSQEMRAYGGGSARVQGIREQITRTLKQFPTVNDVRIGVEGQFDGVLQP